jgi:hypothetical protein
MANVLPMKISKKIKKGRRSAREDIYGDER